MRAAKLIYDVPEKNADLYYACGFKAPDPFLFIEHRGKKTIVMSDLEIDRARREARVDRVLSINPFSELARKKSPGAGLPEMIREVLRELKVTRVAVPRTTPFALVDALRAKGVRVEAGEQPFYPERFSKSAAELRCIAQAQRAVFGAMAMSRDVLAASRIKGRRLSYRGTTLTSERLRTMINVFLLERGFQATDTIVACGSHAIDPHDVGSGPLLAHQAVIVDIFPRSIESYYCGDATRTFCRGRASEALKKLYATVLHAQKLGIGMVREGVNGRKIHEAIHAFFAKQGYRTGVRNGRNEGFFHGTGHGIGLEVHEEPARITARDYTLRRGNVFSVEPGLYYSGIGGVRIEDLVVVRPKGCEVIGGFPRRLEI